MRLPQKFSAATIRTSEPCGPGPLAGSTKWMVTRTPATRTRPTTTVATTLVEGPVRTGRWETPARGRAPADGALAEGSDDAGGIPVQLSPEQGAIGSP